MTTLEEVFGDQKTLTASINELPWTQGLIGKKQIFSENGIETTTMVVEFDGESIDLVPSAPRGGVGRVVRDGVRSGFEITAIHLPTTGSVMADSAQDRRGFGGVNLESPQQLRDRKLLRMKNNLISTVEWHQLGAIKGTILDADGTTVLYDLYSEFGLSQSVKSLSLTTPGSHLLNKVIDCEREAEDALGDTKPTGYLALASASFMDSLRAHSDYVTVLQWDRPSDLTADYRTGITVGSTTFIEYRSPPGGLERIAPGEAYMLPLGVKDLFMTRFAPADFIDTVNTLGMPFYASSEPMPFNRGYFLHAQSNPVSICTRPKTVLKLTL